MSEPQKYRKKNYSLHWWQYITLNVDRPPWYQRIFGYKKTISKWVKIGMGLKGIDPDKIEFIPSQEGLYDALTLEENVTPTAYCRGDNV